jgi:hypothetical protein
MTAALWRVNFYDFRHHHDWVGPIQGKMGLPSMKRRKKAPPEQRREFRTREEAEWFVGSLRHDLGDDLAAQIVDLSTPPPPPTPRNQMLPGHWPRQISPKRRDRK